MLSISSHLQEKLSQALKIGSVEVKSRVLQSPLSGVTDLVFRRLVRRYSPNSMMYTEMVSATEIHHLKPRSSTRSMFYNERFITNTTLFLAISNEH